LRAVDPNAFAFAVPTPRGSLVGASPELLVRRIEPVVAWGLNRIGAEIAAMPILDPRSPDEIVDDLNAL